MSRRKVPSINVEAFIILAGFFLVIRSFWVIRSFPIYGVVEAIFGLSWGLGELGSFLNKRRRR